MFHMYEAIIITKILMHFCSQKVKREYVILLPIPSLWERFTYYVNNIMFYVESIAEHIKASLSIHKQCTGTIRWKMTNSNEGSE